MYVFSDVKMKILRRSRFVSLYLEVDSMADLGDVILTLRAHGIELLEMNIDERHAKVNRYRVEAEIVTQLPADMDAGYMISNVAKLERVNHVHEI